MTHRLTCSVSPFLFDSFYSKYRRNLVLMCRRRQRSATVPTPVTVQLQVAPMSGLRASWTRLLLLALVTVLLSICSLDVVSSSLARGGEAARVVAMNGNLKPGGIISLVLYSSNKSAATVIKAVTAGYPPDRSPDSEYCPGVSHFSLSSTSKFVIDRKIGFLGTFSRLFTSSSCVHQTRGRCLLLIQVVSPSLVIFPRSKH